eukprot:Hpha_TRINITY_DN14999_c0_g1::TRINITY_DN14999_c0_g1_i1::g.143601::m.143601
MSHGQQMSLTAAAAEAQHAALALQLMPPSPPSPPAASPVGQSSVTPPPHFPQSHPIEGEDQEPGNVICAFNLPHNTQDDQLKEFFSQFGNVLKIFTIREKQRGCSRCKGYAFVYFKDIESAMRAKEGASGAKFQGRQLRVDFSTTQRRDTGEAPPSQVLCVFGLPGEVSEDEVRQGFSEHGEIAANIQLVRERTTGRCRGYGFIYFTEVHQAQAAKESCPALMIRGHMVRVDYSHTHEPREADRGQTAVATSFPRGARPCKVLGVFGLPRETSEADIRILFTPYSKVSKVEIVNDRGSKMCKGYAFAYFETVEYARLAYEGCTRANGPAPTVRGQVVRVDYSLTMAPPQTRGATGPGGGGAGGRHDTQHLAPAQHAIVVPDSALPPNMANTPHLVAHPAQPSHFVVAGQPGPRQQFRSAQHQQLNTRASGGRRQQRPGGRGRSDSHHHQESDQVPVVALEFGLLGSGPRYMPDGTFGPSAPGLQRQQGVIEEEGDDNADEAGSGGLDLISRLQVLTEADITPELERMFPLPKNQLQNWDGQYVKGYEESRLDMLRLLDGYLRSGRLHWGDMPPQQQQPQQPPPQVEMVYPAAVAAQLAGGQQFGDGHFEAVPAQQQQAELVGATGSL